MSGFIQILRNRTETPVSEPWQMVCRTPSQTSSASLIFSAPKDKWRQCGHRSVPWKEDWWRSILGFKRSQRFTISFMKYIRCGIQQRWRVQANLCHKHALNTHGKNSFPSECAEQYIKRTVDILFLDVIGTKPEASFIPEKRAHCDLCDSEILVQLTFVRSWSEIIHADWP